MKRSITQYNRQKHSKKIIDEEMSIRTLPITLLQIFCKIIRNSNVFVKSTSDPDEKFCRNSSESMG